MKFKQFIMMVLLIWLFARCEITESINGNMVSIEGNINFKLMEGYEDDMQTVPQIYLKMRTEKIYPCCNYPIESSLKIYGNKVNIQFFGIYIPEICLTALGPATSSIRLNIQSGRYNLYFKNVLSLDIYEVTVADASISIRQGDPDLNSFTNPDYELYWRYPMNSFVYMCGTTTENAWMCTDFLDTLKQEINLQEFNFPDYGQKCYPDSSTGHYYDMPAKYFYYENEEDFDKAGLILESYTQKKIIPNMGIGLSLRSWKNKKYYSWMMD